MLKYNFKELKKPIIIDEPAVQDIIILNNNKSVSVTVTTARGLDETKLEVNPGEDLRLTVQIGDVEGIRWGGTDNWGYYKLILPIGAEAGSVEYDSITVNDITVDPTGGVGAWCTCEKVYNGTDYVLKYTAIEANPSTEPRYALFKHSTTDKIISRGDGAGRPAASEWWVTVMLEGSENTNPTPKPDPEPDPEPQPDPEPEPTPEEGMLTFEQLLDLFNTVLLNTGHNRITEDKEVYGCLQNEYNFANNEWKDNNSEYFDKNNMPEVFNFNGNNTQYRAIAYNAMLAWLMASQLAEYVPTYGNSVNTQTELFKTAYRITGANEVPMYGDYDVRSDVNKVREAAAYICAYLHHEYDAEQLDRFRNELGGESINASSWEDLGYENTMLTDEFGRIGYEMNNLGYLVNTQMFILDAPGPRVPGTTVNELPFPYEEGEPESLFNLETGNYKMDETIHDYMVQNYNMMAQTPIEEWNSYSEEKKERIINAMATIPCTSMYMFGAPKKVSLVDTPIVDGYLRYVFDKDSNGDFTIEGPFSDLAGIYRYNAIQKNELEQFICNVLEIADNSRFPTQDPNYGRCRPGCTCTRQGGEANPIHGSKENELYNISISCMVADTDEEKERWSQEDGFAADSPRSYVSGHSAQIVAMALILSQLNPDKTIDYMRKAHEYSVNRSIARFHWNSDCIQGRLFGTMIAPILRAMTGLQSGFDKVKLWIESPKPEGDWSAKIIIKNETGSSIDSTGEIRMYVDDHIGVNTYLPNAQSIGPIYTFEPEESEYDGINCILNEDDYMDDAYNGSTINEIRIYDYRHWNNIDAGFNATLDTDDPRCDSTLKKSGGTYVIKLTNL